VRTARGAGRLDFFERAFAVPLPGAFVRDRLPDDRVVDEDVAPALMVGLEGPLVREPGGEDVRVAMLTNLHRCHSSHTLHTPEPGTSRATRAEVTSLMHDADAAMYAVKADRRR